MKYFLREVGELVEVFPNEFNEKDCIEITEEKYKEICSQLKEGTYLTKENGEYIVKKTELYYKKLRK